MRGFELAGTLGSSNLEPVLEPLGELGADCESGSDSELDWQFESEFTQKPEDFRAAVRALDHEDPDGEEDTTNDYPRDGCPCSIFSRILLGSQLRGRSSVSYGTRPGICTEESRTRSRTSRRDTRMGFLD
jgi:hypothetical protein